MESDLQPDQGGPTAAPVPIEGAMATGIGDDDPDETMTIGDKLGPDAEDERTDPQAVADAARALGADAAPSEDEAATAPAAQI